MANKDLKGKIAKLETQLEEYRNKEKECKILEERKDTMYKGLLELIGDEEMDKLLDKLIGEVCDCLGAEQGCIYLYNSEKDILVLESGYGHLKKDMDLALKPKEGASGKAFDTKEILIIDDYNTWEGRSTNKEYDVLKGLIAVPFEYNENKYGVLCVANLKDNQKFREKEIEILKAYTSTTSIILKKANLYKKLREARNKSEHDTQMRLIGEVTSGVANDLKNPLTPLLQICEFLKLTKENDSELITKVNTIENSAQRINEITNDLLSYSKKSENKMPITLRGVIEDYINSKEFKKIRSQQDNIEYICEIDFNSKRIDSTECQLKEILSNILNHASESIRGQGIIRIRNYLKSFNKTVTCYDDKIIKGDYAVIEIIDTGKHMNKEEISNIFTPFYITKVMNRKGTGLRMANVKKIIKEHDGYIKVHSKKNKGTRFQIYFPIKQ